ncbi:heavy metal translocating P-type ATPase [Algimonas porphyrae]|uniref:Copper-translocating P-type ATPase n=1 Tax=Algimonas porphyrae TaxID=1128113 RepID=A0ABQ5V3S7_9PROT|nr:heavy metal translocating P-type ATPase [Algimonas porphyrae]GLQ21632.1 copper-translocating P-type ATPase [Algimonas porphyrae]
MSVTLAPFVRIAGGSASVDLVVDGARCGGCLAKIENGLQALPEVTQARMNLTTSRLHLVWNGPADAADLFARKLEEMGFRAAPYIQNDSDQRDAQASRMLLMAMAAAAFGLMNVMMLSIAVWSGGADMAASTRTLLHWVSAAIALPIAAYAGRPFFLSAWQALRVRTTNMDVPISLAILLACGLSLYETWHGHVHTYFDAALMLIFLLLIGRFLDARLRARTGMAARQLAALQVTDAKRLRTDGQVETLPATQVRPGDQLIVARGERIPADGIILSGNAQIDAALVTGETALQALRVGDIVYSGTINRSDAITVSVLKASSDSFLADITAMVEAGQQTQARYVRLADRAARAYVPVVHSLALLTLVGWLIAGGTPRTAILNAIAVLIITCPCALGLAVPAVQVTAVGRLFSRGILVRSGDALERLATISHVVFDKTGTLTRGQITPDVTAIDHDDLARIGTLARQSSHPLSEALHIYAADLDVAKITEVEGEGLMGEVDGQSVRLGQTSFVGAGDQIDTGLWARIGDQAPVHIPVSDRTRPEARTVVRDLSDMGLSVRMLTGDAPDTAAQIAQELGIEMVEARVKPAQKLAHISALQDKGRSVLMVGDGINDAPALSHANASAALASGTEISRSASDIVLQGDTLAGLPFAFRVARSARARVRENFGLAIGYNMLAVPLAVFGHVTPLVAALAMSASSLIVTLNALRLRREGAYEGPAHPGQTYVSPARTGKCAA